MAMDLMALEIAEVSLPGYMALFSTVHGNKRTKRWRDRPSSFQVKNLPECYRNRGVVTIRIHDVAHV